MEETINTLRKRLRVLHCPFTDVENILNKVNIVNIISWLEDTVIRLYPPEKRTPLRENNDRWNQAFGEYLQQLSCPYTEGYSEDNKAKLLLWILNYAIGVSYQDNASSYNNVQPTNSKTKTTFEIDRKTLQEICSMLSIEYHDNMDLISIITNISNELKRRYPKGLHSIPVQTNSKFADWDYKRYPLGFDTKNELLNKCAVVMKLLYLEDLKQIQIKANKIIVAVQEFTGNPNVNVDALRR